MSFSSELKGELARITPEKKESMLAEISGFLRVSGSLRLAGRGKFTIVASTESPAIARHYKKLITDYYNINAKLEINGSQAPGKAGNKGYRYSLTIRPEDKSELILREAGMLLIKEGVDYLSDGIYFPIVKSKSSKKAYLRGLFLGCGTISDPGKSYHLEFLVETKDTAHDVKKLIGSFEDLSAHISERKGNYVVYVKKAGYISDIMGIMGAYTHMFEFENIKINKSLRGEASRIANCDNANVDRAVTASEKQLADIRKIEKEIGLENIPLPLRKIAVARLNRPAANLTEIGESLSKPIKKSGVSKRFEKIREIADKI